MIICLTPATLPNIWSEPFCPAHAFVDLLLLADEHGEVRASERQLAHRWTWTRHAVRNYIKSLRAAGLLNQDFNQISTSIFIANIELYQHVGKKVTRKLNQISTSFSTSPKPVDKPASKTNQERASFPVSLDCPECHAAWADWLAYKKERRESYKSLKTQELQLRRMAPMGAKRFCAAIEFSMAQGWKGIFEERSARSAQSEIQDLFEKFREEDERDMEARQYEHD